MSSTAVPQSAQFVAARAILTDPSRGAKLQETFSNQEKLAFYGLGQQGTSGDATGKRPGMLDMKKRYMFDSHHRHLGMAPAEAQAKYVELFFVAMKTYASSERTRTLHMASTGDSPAQPHSQQQLRRLGSRGAGHPELSAPARSALRQLGSLRQSSSLNSSVVLSRVRRK